MNDEPSACTSLFGIDKDTLQKMSEAAEHLLFGFWLPVLDELMNGPKAIGGKASKRRKLETMKAWGLVDCDPRVYGKPQLWWITEQGFLAIEKYHHNSSDTELQKTAREMETFLEGLSQ
jgi:hypothetical protein